MLEVQVSLYVLVRKSFVQQISMVIYTHAYILLESLLLINTEISEKRMKYFLQYFGRSLV